MKLINSILDYFEKLECFVSSSTVFISYKTSYLTNLKCCREERILQKQLSPSQLESKKHSCKNENEICKILNYSQTSVSGHL